MEVGIRNDLVFGTVSANDFGIYISGEGVYNAPERVVELLDVPGRNGALTIDMGHYGNITIEYPAFTFADSQTEFRRKLNAYKNAIMAQVGYQKLSDTYHPDEYRLGMFVEGLDVEPVGYGRSGSFTLRFNCKPQRYLSSGDEPVTVEDDDVINNPTLYDAEPLLIVEGYGNIEFNGYVISLDNAEIGTVEPPSEKSKQATASRDNTIVFDYGDKFDTGDTLSIYVRAIVQMTSDYSRGAHTETESGTITADSTYLSTVSSHYMTLRATFDKLDYTVGTSKTDTYTLQSAVTMGGTDCLVKLYLTIVFDGVSKFTITSSAEETNGVSSSRLRVNMTSLDVSGFTAVSSLNLLGNPTYIDCAIGEAYRYKDGNLLSLNAYIDLGSDLPKLSPGANTFDMDNTITELKVITRWWEL